MLGMKYNGSLVVESSLGERGYRVCFVGACGGSKRD